MKAGISKIRNGAIAKIFAYMNLIEAWGTGIPKIFEEAKDYGLREPELQDMGSDFRINLYRKEMMVDAYGEKLKAYLINGARRISALREYPNPQLGWGVLCLKDSLPE